MVPRSVAIITARRFGDRLMIDVFYVPLVTGVKIPFLGMLDDASVYYSARHLVSIGSVAVIGGAGRSG